MKRIFCTLYKTHFPIRKSDILYGHIPTYYICIRYKQTRSWEHHLSQYIHHILLTGIQVVRRNMCVIYCIHYINDNGRFWSISKCKCDFYLSYPSINITLNNCSIYHVYIYICVSVGVYMYLYIVQISEWEFSLL